MKIKIDYVMQTLDCEPFVDERGKDLTVKEVLRGILLGAPEKEGKDSDPKRKIARYDLALKVTLADKEVDISAEEISMIKELGVYLSVGLYGSLVYYLETGKVSLKESGKEPKTKEA